MLSEFREWLMLIFEGYICYILTMEYFYDAAKDEAKKQHKRTRTTKKTTTNQSGEIVTEESVESVESKGENNEESRPLS